jgi:DNA processing protein
MLLKQINYEILLKLLSVFLTPVSLYNQTQNVEEFKNMLIKNKIYIKRCLFMELINKELKNKADNIFFYLKSVDLKIVSFLSREYPKKLLNLFSPPIVLILSNYNESILTFPKIYIEDLYNLTKYGQRFLSCILSDINCKKYSIVLKETKNTMENNFKNKVYIKCINIEELSNHFRSDVLSYLEKKNESVIVVPYSLNNLSSLNTCFNAKKSSYIRREDIITNEIIAGLSSKLLILETKLDIESLNLLDMFLELGKDIYALPGEIFESRSYLANLAIRSGAHVITKKEDIFI